MLWTEGIIPIWFRRKLLERTVALIEIEVEVETMAKVKVEVKVEVKVKV